MMVMIAGEEAREGGGMTVAAHDPGGKVRRALPAGVQGWATFSECGRYRLALGRDDMTMTTYIEGIALFVGMNPSTAEADVDDPTIIREFGFTRRWGYRQYVKVNVGDYRCTNPSGLSAPGVVACTEENIAEILRRARSAAVIVMAHGVLPKPLIEAGDRITRELLLRGHKLFCLGKTKSGAPRHPLYVRGDQPLETYP